MISLRILFLILLSICFFNACAYQAVQWANQAQEAVLKKNPVLAIDYYKHASQLSPNHADYYFQRAKLLHSIRREQEALQDYSRAIELTPNVPEYYYYRGNLYAIMQQYPLAIADYQNAIQLQPDLIQTYLNQGRVLDKMRKSEAALSSYQEGLHQLESQIMRDPQNPEYYLLKAELFAVGSGELELALDNLDMAILLKPDFTAAYRQRAILHMLNQHCIRANLDFLHACFYGDLSACNLTCP